MKKWTGFVLVVAVLTTFWACKPDAPLQFNSPDGIYFNAASDSIYYTFAKYPNRVVDTVKVPVNVLGKPSDQEREIIVTPLAGSDAKAVENKHYKLLPPYKIPANSTTALIPVVVYRTSDLDNEAAVLKLELKENSHFEVGIKAKSTIKVKVGYLQKPPSWGDPSGILWAGYSDNFGTWTKTKYKLILDALYSPSADTTITEFPISRFGTIPAAYTQYLQIVKNYIRTNYPGNYNNGVGATLRDPDVPNNPYIQVGKANY
ncbi:DUF4843 domain-containing protein [Chitinophagaceae bacterium LB-8]|uniref:DUF4843 domain-containing protein n=1 Tax=Paraflavisolibacter caeni TaxID=2982496 RepID=A0A9X3BFG7_9BACT|nr:DUF4843 domain-containing protein [Paraflavisolibacter caeni]MCU7548814.1 DUF4843 domain-containing protein [Paraflavisolibacter caeni]